MTSLFMERLLQSGYIHKLLKPDKSRSAEARILQKKILKTRALSDNPKWENEGDDGGEMSYNDGVLHISLPARKEYAEQMPRYWGYTQIKTTQYFPEGDDWREYNRIRCKCRIQ